MGVCQKNCAIDYSKCLILTFDMFTCSQQEAACALDCLKSAEVEVSVSVWCGRCMDFVAPQAEAACALDCLKGVKDPKFEVKVSSGNVGTCEKNCGIDFGKCLIETGDFKNCIKSQTSCALDCLKTVSSHKSVKQS